MKSMLALLFLGLTFLAGCQYIDGYIVHDAKAKDVYQQAMAYGIMRGYTVKYEDRANGLLAFKTGEDVSAGQTKTTETETAQFNNNSTYKNENDSHEKDNNRDKEKHKEDRLIDNVVNQVSVSKVKTRVSQTTSTPTRVYEKGLALQFIQKGHDVEVKVKTFGPGYGGSETEQVLNHFKDKWSVEPIIKED